MGWNAFNHTFLCIHIEFLHFVLCLVSINHSWEIYRMQHKSVWASFKICYNVQTKQLWLNIFVANVYRGSLIQKIPLGHICHIGQKVTAADNLFPRYARFPYPLSEQVFLNINFKQCPNEVQAFGIETIWPDVIWCWLAVGNPAQMWGTLGCFIFKNHYQSLSDEKHSHTWQRNVSVTEELRNWQKAIHVDMTVCMSVCVWQREGTWRTIL